MKTCPSCGKAAGVRTLKCECGQLFASKAKTAPPPIPAPPKITPPEDLKEGRAGVTEVLYDTQGQAALSNGAPEGPSLRPIVCLALTEESLASFVAGGCVPAILNHKEVYLQLQVRRN